MGNDICNPNPDPNPTIQEQMTLRYDQQDQMVKISYNIFQLQQRKMFRKILYNWHSIPITTIIDLQRAQRFSVKNMNTTNDNFVVGIIKRKAIFQQRIPRPWTTDNVICYQSHSTPGHSSIIYNNDKVLQITQGIPQTQIITVIIINNTIKFYLNHLVLGSFVLPQSFRTEPILPYVALFSEGDRILFISPLERQRRN